MGTVIRQESIGFAVNGKGYIVAGDNCSSGDNYQDVWEFDPNSDTWTQLEDFTGSARRYPDAFVIGKKAYVGLGTSGVNYADLWEFDQTLSVIQHEQDLVNFKAYPNPITEKATFELNNIAIGSNFQDYSISIYNLSGQIIYTNRFDSKTLDFERNAAKSGNYVYVITYNDTKVRSGQIVMI